MLTVKNGNGFDFVGRYDGQDYYFPKGKMTAVPDDAAKHIFGVGVGDKTDVLVRHGWMTHSAEFDAGMQKLNGFSFNVANELNAGDIVDVPDNGQGSAPLQLVSGGEGVSSDAQQPSDSISSSVAMTGGGSILDKLSGASS